MASHITDVVKAQARQRDQADRDDSTRGRIFAVNGTCTIVGIGEVIYDVTFPVTFIERPHFTDGVALDIGQQVVAGAFPGADSVVISWVALNEDKPELITYTGARLAIRTRGVGDEQAIILNFRFEGMALVNPIGGVDAHNLDDRL